MKSNYKVYCAVAAVLGAHVAPTFAADADAEGDQGSLSLNEVVVTAQRRTENIQNVPIAIQALTAETLTQLNVQTFDDYVKYVPSVSYKSNGPGQSIIYMRGLSAGASAGSQSTGTIGGFPNVAIYLDDQSASSRAATSTSTRPTWSASRCWKGRREHCSAREPKPVSSAISRQAAAQQDRGQRHRQLRHDRPWRQQQQHHGDAQSAGHRGHPGRARGHLQRQPRAATSTTYRERSRAKTATSASTTPATRRAAKAAGARCPRSPVANNNSLVQNNFNPVTYQGIRASALYQINDDWNALVTQSYQNMKRPGRVLPDAEQLRRRAAAAAAGNDIQPVLRQG